MSSPRSAIWRPGHPEPVKVVRAEGCCIWTEDGRQLLDACGSGHVVTIGHGCRPVLERIAQEQAQLSFCGNRELIPAWAEEGVSRWLGSAGLQDHSVLFVNSGTEALEAAAQIALAWHTSRGQPERRTIVGVEDSYHGFSQLAISVGGNRSHRSRIGSMLLDQPVLPRPWASIDAGAATGSFSEALAEFRSRQDPRLLLGVVLEPCGGTTAGALSLDERNLRTLCEFVESSGGLLIADEVVTGCGRTGGYLRSQTWHRRPDIVMLSKGLTSGYAVGAALLCRKTIVEQLAEDSRLTAFFRTTYGANPASIAAILAVQSHLLAEDLIARARHGGEMLREAMRSLLHAADDSACVVGEGQLSAVHLLERTSRHGAPGESTSRASRVARKALERGVLLMSGGPWSHGDQLRSHILLTPPFTIAPNEINSVAEVIAWAIAEEGR
jgi:adenosylmethionine-8-amino-7-oxononanoate aminotransferase